MMSSGVYAQTTAYPQYDKNGVRVKASSRVQVDADAKPVKGTLTKRNRSGLLINVGTYEVKGDELEIYKSDVSGMLHLEKKVRIDQKDAKEIILD